MPYRASIAISIVTSVLLAATAWKMYQGVNFRRPLEGDEAISLEYYTWAGVNPDGERFRLRRIEDFHRRPAPGLRLFGLGVYCSLGRWAEPNNHLLNSLMMDVSLALLPRDERSARLPALGFAVLFGGLFVGLCRVYLGSAESALPALVCLLWCPYLVQYSQEARGYTAMLALQAVLMLALRRVVEAPNSIAWGALCASICLASILNVISLAVDWILPVYLSMLLFSFGMGRWHPASSPLNTIGLRRNLLIQGLAVGVASFIFLIGHLPAVVSSMGLYGLKVASLSRLPSMIGQSARELFPSAMWIGFAVAGFVGLLACVASRRGRSLLLLASMTAGVSLVHFALTRRLPYARTLGYFLPFVFLGVANLVRLTLKVSTTRPRRLAIWATWGCISGWMVAPSLVQGDFDADRTALLRAAEAADSAPDRPTYALMGKGFKSDSLGKYLPGRWIDEYDDFPTRDAIRIALFYRDDDGKGMPIDGPPGASPWEPAAWTGGRIAARPGPLRLVLIDGQAGPLGTLPSGGQALIFWYPDPQSVAVSPNRVLEFLGKSESRYLTQMIRHQVKLDSFGRLRCVILVAGSPDGTRDAKALASEAADRFGGWITTFRPSGPLGPPN